MNNIIISLAIIILCVGCQTINTPNPTAPLALGDTKKEMIQKMTHMGAANVTDQTPYVLSLAMSGKQQTYWWQLPDKTIVGVNLAGRSRWDLAVYTIEIGEPGLGIKGIENWRSQDLKTQTYSTRNNKHNKPRHDNPS